MYGDLGYSGLKHNLNYTKLENQNKTIRLHNISPATNIHINGTVHSLLNSCSNIYYTLLHVTFICIYSSVMTEYMLVESVGKWENIKQGK